MILTTDDTSTPWSVPYFSWAYNYLARDENESPGTEADEGVGWGRGHERGDFLSEAKQVWAVGVFQPGQEVDIGGIITIWQPHKKLGGWGWMGHHERSAKVVRRKVMI